MLAAGSKTKETVSQNGHMTVEAVGTNHADLLGEVGVYVVQGSKLTSVEPEIVNWRTGGVLKSIATVGLDKGHVNGTVSGSTSKLNLASPPQLMPDTMVFYFHCLEGTSAAEYQLLRLWGKGDRREFRAVTGGILHASGGARDNVVEFKYEKVSPRIYKVSVPRLNIGEYGFLAPGAVATACRIARKNLHISHCRVIHRWMPQKSLGSAWTDAKSTSLVYALNDRVAEENVVLLTLPWMHSAVRLRDHFCLGETHGGHRQTHERSGVICLSKR
jgi:hypothetical protein